MPVVRLGRVCGLHGVGIVSTHEHFWVVGLAAGPDCRLSALIMATGKAAATAVTASGPRTIRMLVPAATAKPSPALGQALGQLGVNMMKFCKEFNEATKAYKPDVPMRVKFTVYPDSSFAFRVKYPPISWFLLQASGCTSGAAQPGKEWIGRVHAKQVYEIAKLKQTQEHCKERLMKTESVCRMVAAQMKTMGLVLDMTPNRM